MLWQLAIETSGRTASASLLYGSRQMHNAGEGPERPGRTAANLAPMLAELIAKIPGGRGSLGLVSVASGPGSFTGLRIGVTAAKTLAYALACPLVECDALEVITRQVFQSQLDPFPSGVVTAEGVPAGADRVAAVIEAYRSQVFMRIERRDGVVELPSTVLGYEAARQRLRQQAEEATGGVWVAGPALSRRGDLVPPGVALAAPTTWAPRAETVGQVAWSHFERGESIDPLRLVPRYLRDSAAEEKLSR